MSSFLDSRHEESTWWQQLGLTVSSLGVNGDLRGAAQEVLAILSEYEPVTFAARSDREDCLTLEQVRQRVSNAERTHQREAENVSAAAAESRRRLGWKKINAAYAAPDATEKITVGRWAGFTRADATAWCWNLFQYEPHGFVHPGSEARHRAIALLEAGGLPEVFGYPERARELQVLGLTPKEYREHKEALGAPTFSADAITRARACIARDSIGGFPLTPGPA